MELTVKLENDADISFIKKLLLQLKGVKSIDVSEEKEYSLEEIESSEDFKKALDKSFQQIEEGKFVEHSEELMDKIFGK
ncbi:hypothetical protein SAMN05660493_01832 [Epilithonimonas bovis DSM 19482]|jgi:hypothetical protein|uniref:Uncharacterized protein n=1 Tax=Epilithonimonas bovis DSM 19482 TaxID=1121284 RepID=A0A1U7PYP8_9FLAO|nr:hypothetical protein [Epilithonimonas bovis]SIT97123.1 hypothetical protein SAMN05660493_01832 [Epilithonimonas bovis DSM 19482]